MSDTPEVNFDAVSKTFSGEVSEYSVIATRGEEAMGVSIDYEAMEAVDKGILVVRFVSYTSGTDPQVFKFFHPRSAGLFDRNKPTSFYAVRLDKLKIPVFSTAVNPYKALAVGNDLGVWDAVGSWLSEVLAQEGFTPTVLNMSGFVRSEIKMGGEDEEVVESLFTPLHFEEHEELIIVPQKGEDLDS